MTQKIAFITETGNYQADKIFSGAYGTLNEQGVFEISSDLKGIHLFNLLTPAALAAQGVDLGGRVHIAEIDEATAPALRATMLTALKKQWLDIYDTQQVPAGFAAAALQSERTMVEQAVDKAVAEIGLPLNLRQIARSFTDVSTDTTFTESGDYDSDDIPTGSHLSRSAMCAATVAGAAPWVLSEEVFDMAGLTPEASASSVSPLASGQLVSEISVAGAAPDAQRVLDVVMAMPGILLSRLGVVDSAKYASVEFHTEPRQADQPLGDTAVAADSVTTDESSSAAHAPSA